MSFCSVVNFKAYYILISNYKKFKTNMIPILKHQMRISTNEISSVMLRLKKLENKNKTKKQAKNKKITC
jgi:hypothetical protein